MAAVVEIRIRGEALRRIVKMIDAISPDKNPRIWRDGLTRMADTTVRRAKESFRVGQPRRGDAHPTKITSRDGHLRGSIYHDLSQIPRRATVGSDLPYAAVHEFGGDFRVRGHSRKSRKGKRYKVKPYTAHYPARPYLAPGLETAKNSFADIMIEVIREQLGDLR